MFSLEVFDENFKRYGFIERYTYASYTEKITDAGFFEIKCPAIQENVDIIKRDRIIWFENDTAGIIQCIIKSRSETVDMEVKGLLLSGILEWRYIYPTITVTNMEAQDAMEKYVRENMIASTDARRNFPMLEIGPRRNAQKVSKISKQITGYTVMNGLQKIVDAIPEKVGFKVGFYPREKKYKFYTFVGEDKTTKQEAKSKQVFFSQTFNNVLDLSYTENNEDFRGCALIQAERQVEGEGGGSGTGGGTGSGGDSGGGSEGEGGGTTTKVVVDTELSNVSENPLQNKVIAQEFQKTNNNVETNKSNISTLQTNFDNVSKSLEDLKKSIETTYITVDEQLADSPNPVQNRAINNVINNISNSIGSINTTIQSMNVALRALQDTVDGGELGKEIYACNEAEVEEAVLRGDIKEGTVVVIKDDNDKKYEGAKLDEEVTQESTNPVKSSGIFKFVQGLATMIGQKILDITTSVNNLRTDLGTTNDTVTQLGKDLETSNAILDSVDKNVQTINNRLGNFSLVGRYNSSQTALAVADGVHLLLGFRVRGGAGYVAFLTGYCGAESNRRQLTVVKEGAYTVTLAPGLESTIDIKMGDDGDDIFLIYKLL